MSSNLSISHQDNRAIIRVSGSDAQNLLNNILSAKFNINEKPAKFWALLSPKGKIQAQGFGKSYENAFWLEMHKSVASNFLKKMRLYKMRADVEFTDLRDEFMVGWSKEEPVIGNYFLDPREKELGFHIFAPKQQATKWRTDDNQYSVERIKFAMAELGSDFLPDSLFPHDIAMDLIGGVDFSKGCYIGQEIVSRMQHKGKIKRRVLIASNVEAISNSELISEGKKIGFLGQVVEQTAIAFVRLDKLSDAKQILADGKPIEFSTPKWADYSL